MSSSPSTFRISFKILTGEFKKAMKKDGLAIATAATQAMDGVVAIVKPEGRAAIAAAGFSKRWQNALRVVRYPDKKSAVSYEPSAYIYHKIDYAGVFEDGATITGKPFLWLPLSSTPQRIGQNVTTPTRLASSIGRPLVSFTSRDGTPLLGVRVELSKGIAKRTGPLKLSLAALRRGNTGKKAEGSSLFRTIPLFFGVRETHVPKKLNIRKVCEDARDRIPALYAIAINKALPE